MKKLGAAELDVSIRSSQGPVIAQTKGHVFDSYPRRRRCIRTLVREERNEVDLSRRNGQNLLHGTSRGPVEIKEAPGKPSTRLQVEIDKLQRSCGNYLKKRFAIRAAHRTPPSCN